MADAPAATTEDAIMGGRVRLVQPAQGYRVAIDPVLLAAAVPVRAGERALELGSGTGAAALCLAARVPGVAVTGLERDPALVELAQRGAELSGLADRVRFGTGDILDPPTRDDHDHVFANPPFLKADEADAPAQEQRAEAHVEGVATLGDWLDALLARVRRKGRLTLIHRADRLDEILHRLYGRAGDVTVLPLWPKAGQPARRVIVNARKGVASSLTLAPGLVLHDDDGAFTAAASAVLRDAAALRL